LFKFYSLKNYDNSVNK
jgi:hypothetical protein